MNINKKFIEMKNYHEKLRGAQSDIRDWILNKVEFKNSEGEIIKSDDLVYLTSVFYQPSDGFVFEYNSKNAPLYKCINVILSKGKLTDADYDYLRI